MPRELTNATLTDTTTAQQVGSANSSPTTTLTFAFFGGAVVNAGDHPNATLTGAINPSLASSLGTAKVSTSSVDSVGMGAAGPGIGCQFGCLKTIKVNEPVLKPWPARASRRECNQP